MTTTDTIRLVPYPTEIEAFRELANKSGLVPMKIVQPFAPYLKNQIAGFDPELSARLFVRREAVPVNAKGEAIDIDAPEPVEPKPIPQHAVEIPINWPEIHLLQRVKLAKQIVGDPNRKLTAEEADAIIVAELKRRDEDAAESHEA